MRRPVPMPRSSGVLLHPTSLPGPYGIGDLGPEAYRWVQTLAAAKQAWWQILPLGPTGVGNSPYQAFSAFAGNVALLSPDLLVRDGLVSQGDLNGISYPPNHVDYERVTPFKKAMTRAAWDAFRSGQGVPALRDEFDAYWHRERAWLDDYALFMAVRDALGGASLATWPTEVLKREPSALEAVEQELARDVMVHRFAQFLFDRQWVELRKFAHAHGVKIIGDAPIFVSTDSADMWANADQFLLDSKRQPTFVAGVPPDYFSETGQHWGNPLYDWDRMAGTGYAWWTARLRRNLEQVDLLRLDHFRGFAAAWHIPAGAKTAVSGSWVNGPGRDLFDRMASDLGPLPLIAEDLGLITADVHELREALGYPGMRVIQFTLGGGPDSPHWPHNFERNTVAYTGTHDNDTTNGWYEGLDDNARNQLVGYLGRSVRNPAADLIRLTWSSVAVLAITPLQDLLGLGTEGRMNVPGVAEGNWRWRFRAEQFLPGVVEHLAELTTIYNRVPPHEAA